MSGGIVSALVALWNVIEDYEALIAEASHTFSFTAIDFDDDSYLVLAIDGSVTASLGLALRINGNSGMVYGSTGRRIDSGVETILNESSVTESEISDTSVTNSVNDQLAGLVYIFLNKGATIDTPMFISTLQGAQTNSQLQKTGQLFVDSASITSIEVRTTVSTWQIGSRMTLYRVARS